MNRLFDVQKQIVVINKDAREGTEEYQISSSLHGLET
jgi:hypothetical protein